MIISNREIAVLVNGEVTYRLYLEGYSTDEKPAINFENKTLAVGSEFGEFDTNNLYIYNDNSTWELTALPFAGGVGGGDYVKSINGETGDIILTSADVGAADSADLTAEISRAQTAENNILTAVENDFVKTSYALDQSATPSYNLLKSITIHEDTASTVIVNAWMRDMSGAISDDISAQIPLPLVTETTAGIMPSADHTQITENASNIQSLQSQQAGQNKGTFDTYADLPTIVDEDTGDYATVRADENHSGATTRYYAENSAWWFDYIINNYSPIATQSITGLVQGSNTSGQIYVETNGTMSLVGYDDIVTNISNEISRAQSVENSIISDVDSLKNLGYGLTENTPYLLGTRNGLYVYRFLASGTMNTSTSYNISYLTYYNGTNFYPTELIRAEGYWQVGNGQTGPTAIYNIGHTQFDLSTGLPIVTSYIYMPVPNNSAPVQLYHKANYASVGKYFVDLIFTYPSLFAPPPSDN